MKNVKLYKWLTVTLMLAISVFCLLYLEKIQKSTAPAVAETKTEHTAETDKPERPVFYNTLPKSAYSYNGNNSRISAATMTISLKTFILSAKPHTSFSTLRQTDTT